MVCSVCSLVRHWYTALPRIYTPLQNTPFPNSPTSGIGETAQRRARFTARYATGTPLCHPHLQYSLQIIPFLNYPSSGALETSQWHAQFAARYATDTPLPPAQHGSTFGQHRYTTHSPGAAYWCAAWCLGFWICDWLALFMLKGRADDSPRLGSRTAAGVARGRKGA